MVDARRTTATSPAPGVTPAGMTPGRVPGAGRPWHVWVVGVIGGLWSVMGVVSFMLTQLNVEAVMSGFPPEQRAYFESFSSHVWPVAFWAIGAFGGVIGCLLLLLRNHRGRGLAFPFLLCSVIGWIGCNLGGLFLLGGLKVMREPGDLGFTLLPILFAALLAWYSGAISRRGVLRYGR